MPSTLERIRAKLPFAKYSPEDQQVIALCFAIAFFFWLLVKLSKDYVLTEELQLTYELPIGRAFVNEPPAAVSVELSGTGWRLLGARLPARDLLLEVPIDDGPSYSLTSYQLAQQLAKVLGNGVTIRRLDFPNQRVLLEARSQLKVPVQVPQALAFAPGYSLSQAVQIVPDSVLVEGPASRLAKINAVSTDSLHFNKPLRRSAKKELALRTDVAGLRIFPEQVEVNIPVEQITEKTMYLPVQLINIPAGTDSIAVFPDKAYLKCILGLSKYSELAAADFELVADFEEAYLKEGRNSVPLRLRKAPAYVRNVSFTPASAEFFLVEK